MSAEPQCGLTLVLSAYEESDFRIARLARTVASITSEWLKEVEQLHDHKGCLVVVTPKPPSDLLRKIAESAWVDQNEYGVQFRSGLWEWDAHEWPEETTPE